MPECTYLDRLNSFQQGGAYNGNLRKGREIWFSSPQKWPLNCDMVFYYFIILYQTRMEAKILDAVFLAECKIV